MLAAFGFESLGVVVGDMFFVDPSPLTGQETPERGVRLELRLVDRAAPQGSIYAGIPITFARPCGGSTCSATRKAHPGRWTAPITTPGSTAGNPGHATSSRNCPPIRWAGWRSNWPTRPRYWPERASVPMRSPKPTRPDSPPQPRKSSPRSNGCSTACVTANWRRHPPSRSPPPAPAGFNPNRYRRAANVGWPGPESSPSAAGLPVIAIISASPVP